MRFNNLTKLVMILTILLFVNKTTVAENKVKIGIIPFDINVIENSTDFEKTIPNTIKKKLEQQNINIITENLEQFEALTEDESKKMLHILKDTELDGILWGDISINRNKFTLNINLLNKNGNQPILHISKNGICTKLLLSAIDKTIEELIFSLFKNNIVSEINIEGNIRIKNDIILELIRTKPGDIFKKNQIAADVKTIHNMGCFDSIAVKQESGPTGLIISFKIKESPIIKNISFTGNHRFSKEKIKNNIDIGTDSFLKLSKINSCIEHLNAMYRENDYHNISIRYNVEKLKDNQVNLKFILEEGNKIHINKINFAGNNTFRASILKKLIKSSEKSSLAWLTNSGKFNKKILLHDENQLFNFYRSNGFINVKIGKTITNIEDDSCSITFMIEEGQQFRIGKCILAGDLIESEAKLRDKLEAPKHKWVNTQAVQQDVIKLTKLYSNAGFANVNVSPITKQNTDSTIELTYLLKKNAKIKIKNIEISGNNVTRDNVIRREIKINENDVYNKDKIGLSLYNIRKLHYFESVAVEQTKYETTEQIGLDFKVKERPTGQITFGAGYSSADDFFVNGSISQENFLGKGQSLRLSGTFGNDIDRYNLSYNEPWLFGIPLSGTVRLYKEIDEKIGTPSGIESQENKKNKQVDTGLYIGVSYPLSDFIRMSLGYKYNVSEDKSNGQHECHYLQKYKISSTALTVLFDSRDGSFYTKSGEKHRLTCTYAGLGGNLGFIKMESSLGWYIPLYKKTTLSLRGRYGYIKDINNSGDKYEPLRDSDLFHLGGIDSIRAYNYKTVGVEKIGDEERTVLARGGKQYALLNIELTYPIYENLNLLGVIFYDAGQVFDKYLNKLEDGAGFGIRWLSPLGPIRLEAAYKVSDFDKKIKWNFTIGAPF